MENEITTEQCNAIIDMKIEGSSLSTLWQARQLAEKSQFSADIKHTGFDRRLGRLMVFIHSQYPDRKTLSRKIYTDYGIEGIASQRRSEAKSFEELGEENRSFLIQTYPEYTSIGRLLNEWMKLNASEAEGEAEGEIEGEVEGNGITADQILKLISDSQLSKDDYALLGIACAEKAKDIREDELKDAA